MEEKIIGRAKEIRQIEQYVATARPELIAVYGRRRVGKTFLVRHTVGACFCFYITGVYKASLKEQLRNFGDEMRQRTGNRKLQNPKCWHDAFLMLNNYLSGVDMDKRIVFMDEIPWLDTHKSGFLREFDLFWNRYGSNCDGLKLFVCGSATTWMVSKFIGDKGGLHNRITHSIYLSPFSLRETEDYCKNRSIGWSRYDIVEMYMALGGIPYYLDMIEPGMSVAQNIDNLFFSEHALLRGEFNFLFASLFKNSSLYRRVIQTIARRRQGMTREDIMEGLQLSEGGNLTQCLEDLVQCDFIRTYSPFGKKTRGTMYQLTDLYSLFWLTFVDDTQGQDSHTWTNLLDTPLQNSWKGYAFEMVCLHHLPQIKKALGISGVLSQCQSWTGSDGQEKGQIDLLIDRRDHVINLCEMKFSTNEYNITKQYRDRLVERRELFRRVTGTRSALHLTMITTYGVKKSVNSSVIQNEVVMDDLYE